jgi:hypothetical protein
MKLCNVSPVIDPGFAQYSLATVPARFTVAFVEGG